MAHQCTVNGRRITERNWTCNRTPCWNRWNVENSSVWIVTIFCLGIPFFHPEAPMNNGLLSSGNSIRFLPESLSKENNSDWHSHSFNFYTALCVVLLVICFTVSLNCIFGSLFFSAEISCRFEIWNSQVYKHSDLITFAAWCASFLRQHMFWILTFVERVKGTLLNYFVDHFSSICLADSLLLVWHLAV